MQASFTNLNIEAVDLFCGAGGLSYGLQEAGINVVAGLDLDPHCEFPFTHNLKASFIKRDLSKTEGKELAAYYSGQAITLLAGCAPCQPFSTLRNGSNRQISKKWPLLMEFARVAKDVLPDLITMENVPVLRSQSIFEEFVATLKSLSYTVTYQILDAADYGVPQRRKRLVLLASRLGPIRIVSADELGSKNMTVRDAIGHLPPIAAGETDKHDPLHRARSISEINLERIRASRPGGTWQEWPADLRLRCHTKPTGASYKSVYGRMEWDKHSGTMTTQSYSFGTGRYGHPEQNRSLSLREMALLQSFPYDYQFVPSDKAPSFSAIGRLIGNAVPVKLGYVIGMSILHHVSSTIG